MRSRWAAAAGSVLFLLLAPAVVAGIVPLWIARWRPSDPLLGWVGIRWAGAALILAGALVLFDAFARFALQGRGTPAPPLPTEQLVVSGLYRHVRNPMYLAVLTVVVGQALLLGATSLLAYAALLFAAFHLFIVGYEEPTLRRRFGSEYERYCGRVRRWWPQAAPRSDLRRGPG